MRLERGEHLTSDILTTIWCDECCPPRSPRLATGPLHFLRAPNTCEHLGLVLRFPPTTWSGPLPLGPGQQEPCPLPQAGPTVCGQTDLSEQGLQSHWALGPFGKPSEGSQAGSIKPTCLMALQAGLALSLVCSRPPSACLSLLRPDQPSSRPSHRTTCLHHKPLLLRVPLPGSPPAFRGWPGRITPGSLHEQRDHVAPALGQHLVDTQVTGADEWVNNTSSDQRGMHRALPATQDAGGPAGSHPPSPTVSSMASSNPDTHREAPGPMPDTPVVWSGEQTLPGTRPGSSVMCFWSCG